jgi:hypothetical protein
MQNDELSHRVFIGKPNLSRVPKDERLYREVQVFHEDGTKRREETNIYVIARNTDHALELLSTIRKGPYNSYAKQVID